MRNEPGGGMAVDILCRCLEYISDEDVIAEFTDEMTKLGYFKRRLNEVIVSGDLWRFTRNGITRYYLPTPASCARFWRALDSVSHSMTEADLAAGSTTFIRIKDGQ